MSTWALLWFAKMLSANIISWGLGWYVRVETPLMAVCCCYCIIRIIYSTYIDHVGSDWQAVFPNCNDVKHHNYTPQRHWLLLWTVSHSNKHSLNPVENFRSADINSSVEHKPYILIESFFFVRICTQGQAFPGTQACFRHSHHVSTSWTRYSVWVNVGRFGAD